MAAALLLLGGKVENMRESTVLSKVGAAGLWMGALGRKNPSLRETSVELEAIDRRARMGVFRLRTAAEREAMLEKWMG